MFIVTPADFVLGSASNQLGNIENSMGRMNIGPLLSNQDEVNKNKAETNGQYTDSVKVCKSPSTDIYSITACTSLIYCSNHGHNSSKIISNFKKSAFR